MKILHCIGRCVTAMNEKKMYNRLVETIDRTRRAQYIQDSILTGKLTNEALKMHQKTTWHKDNRPVVITDPNLDAWLNIVVGTDPLPAHSEKYIPLEYNSDFDLIDIKSIRDFKSIFWIEFEELSNILLKAFGRRHSTNKKNYPSAGGLYPIMPVLIVLNHEVLEGIEAPGSYLYSATHHELILLKSFTKQEVEVIFNNFNHSNLMNPNLGIAYAIDMKRSITKYRIRGYRHSLIEVGLMAQSFRQAICEYERLGEVSWSGFNDNAFTHAIGLSPRLAPVALLQWFGEKNDF